MSHHAERATKICPVCGRPFQWRKKWQDVWDEVRYCSERCRRRRSQAAPQSEAVREQELLKGKARRRGGLA